MTRYHIVNPDGKYVAVIENVNSFYRCDDFVTFTTKDGQSIFKFLPGFTLIAEHVDIADAG